MSKINILVVEDEAIVAKDIQQSLKKIGYNVLDLLSSGESVLLCLKENKPDLILLDIMLKGELSGVDVSEHVNNHYKIPIIFLTAYADQSTLDKAKVTEPYGYIIKPFKEVDLHTTIEMALYKHKITSQLQKERDLLYSLVIESNDGKNDMHFVKSQSKYIKLKATDIWYVEALKDYVTINTASDKYTIHSTMKDIEAKLPTPEFVRVHRSFIVRLDKIGAVDNGVVVLDEDKKQIPIGGSYKDQLMSRLSLL